MSKELRDFIKETISIIVIAFILSLILRAFIIEGREIPSGSMLQTLQVDDRVMVNKFIYHFKEPVRGDIVIFDPPEELNSSKYFIKRVIGLPGDKVQMKEGRVFVNDKPLSEPYLAEEINYQFGPVVVPEDSLLVLGDNRNYSFDSHMWNTWLTRDRIKGKAFMIYWPLNHFTLLEREVSFE
ncbi:MAG: signal peptidase I [Syntrophomonas sp.]|uniref:signal peptidase I n=1 Tax=Syntrophomonas sp. TaxID=2053627 RepID=UPI00263337E6|nr:signal peptidase I [Syntrophomonas sp.]MDD2509768.1 signal peptidase I [Syntrophomonas sp.]MDD3878828.1 signal peptidase I [Syntrophomonas sp.]MDD4625739.1 signal peptidase I [Syntrophomonas sp.]